jgi:peptidoglycan/xylan/chitin deacetylase (PgdA/CDA1 family)
VGVPPVLTVDVEDWFHVCGHPLYGDPATWEARPSRVEKGVDRILTLLAPTESRVTFFVLGWVARKVPGLVRRIVGAGHEVGCHGDLHRRVFELTRDGFREDVVRSRETLQEIHGRRVTSYRAATFEDAVIFVHDVERSLEELSEFEKTIIGTIVLKEYTQREAARVLGYGHRTITRYYPEALDRVSEIFLRRQILTRLPSRG